MSEWGLDEDEGVWEAPDNVGSATGVPFVAIKQEEDSHAWTQTATTSGVDGKGMWKAWAHSYDKAQNAMLDLLDNCFDATLSHDNNQQQFQGKVAMDSLGRNGIVITNNSYKPIKDLAETLTAYRSIKNSSSSSAVKTEEDAVEIKKDEIGEYGVGLKQACATLSNVSYVLTKNTTGNSTQFQFGVIAEDLQTTTSVTLPHFTIRIDPSLDVEEAKEQLITELDAIMRDNCYVKIIVSNTLGLGNRKEGVAKLAKQFLEMQSEDDEWKDESHVFQLIITDFIFKGATTESTNNVVRREPARAFLEDMRQVLLKHYINVPLHGFEFAISGEVVQFSYWQQRLVEMTKFEVYVHKEKPVEQLSELNFAQHPDAYKLSIYCGFDPLRLNDSKKASTCSLWIYSRQSGRLIQIEDDARATLGLTSSGSDYCQGLTVVIDDVNGELPLKPSKDGLTWSKEKAGRTHEANLLSWTGAVSREYYHYHLLAFKKVCKDDKTQLNNAVTSFAPKIEQRIRDMKESENIETGPTLERVEDANFTMFSDVRWKRDKDRYSKKLTIRKATNTLQQWVGEATQWRITEEHIKVAKQQGKPLDPNKKRASISQVSPATKRRRSTITAAGAGMVTPPQLGKRKASAPVSYRDESSSGEKEEEEEATATKLKFGSPASVRYLATGKLKPTRKAPVRKRQPPPAPSRLQRTSSEAARRRDSNTSSRMRQLESDLAHKDQELRDWKAKVQKLQSALDDAPKEEKREEDKRQLQAARHSEERMREMNEKLFKKLEEASQKLSAKESRDALIQEENEELKARNEEMAKKLDNVQRLQQACINMREENKVLKQQLQQQQQQQQGEENPNHNHLVLQLQHRIDQLERQVRGEQELRSSEAANAKLVNDSLRAELKQYEDTATVKSESEFIRAALEQHGETMLLPPSPCRSNQVPDLFDT